MMNESKPIPALGSIVTVPLFGETEKPVSDVAMPDADYAALVAQWERRSAIKLKVKLAGRSVVRRSAYALEKIEAEEKANLRAMRADDKAEDPLRPELFKEGYRTEKGADDIVAHMRAVLTEILVGVSGLEIEGVDLAGERDVVTLLDILDHTDLLFFAYYAALAAQKPKLSQLF